MLHPEDDIEEVYRQFAERYPLKAGDSGWDELEAKLSSNNTAPGPQRTVPRRMVYVKRYRYALAALLLLAILTAGLTLFNFYKRVLPVSSITVPAGGTKQQKAINPQVATSAPGSNTRAVTPDSRLPGTSGMPDANLVRTTTAINIHTPAKAGGNVRIQANIAPPPVVKEEVAFTPLPQATAHVMLPRERAGVAAIPGVINLWQYNTVPIPPVRQTLAEKSLTAAAGRINAAPIHFKKRLYVSLLAGPDVSMVKFQGGSNAGISGGVMADIKLSKKLSIETGLLVDKKNYFSAGKYFNKTNAGITGPDENISAVNGIGNFVELPVIARFTIAGKKKGGWFVAAGLSSYITERERYTLDIDRPAGQERRDTDDDDRLVNLFSLMHLSAGYSYPISNRGSIQFEPYLKLPFSGIGRGLLPITSTGVYVKYTLTIGK